MEPLHEEAIVPVNAAPDQVFGYLDDHRNLSAHMGKSSWMMAGARMKIDLDAGHGRVVGSRIRLRGRVAGIELAVEEAVTEHVPPYRKTWKTLGEPRLLVIGPYQMGFELIPLPRASGTSQLKVFIDYQLPAAGSLRWLRRKLAAFYARWCTRRMAADCARHFSRLEDQKMSASTTPFDAAPSSLGAQISRRIDPRSLGLAAAYSVGIAFALCSLVVLTAPGEAARFVSYALHIELSGLEREITPLSFLAGLGFLMLYSYAIVSATGALYNRLIARRA